MSVKVAGQPGAVDMDDVQAPPRPPVKEASRNAEYPRVLAPRPDLTAMRRSPPLAKPASPSKAPAAHRPRRRPERNAAVPESSPKSPAVGRRTRR